MGLNQRTHTGALARSSLASSRALLLALRFEGLWVKTEVNSFSVPIGTAAKSTRNIHSASPLQRHLESRKNPRSVTSRRRKNIPQLKVERWHVQV